MSESFNLIDSPWIPVLMTDGQTDVIGLHALFDCAESIADFAVRPEERVALMRLLMCISYASQGTSPWDDHLNELEADALDYLNRWRDSFWLHHDVKPFLQIAGLVFAGKNCDKLTPLTKLDFALATGNNAQLNDHGGIEFDEAMTARGLLVFQCFSPGGLISPICWNGSTTTKNSVDAPCIPSGMLHAFLRGHTLGRTLRLNLPSPAMLVTRFKRELGSEVMGRPVWEQFPSGPNDEAAVHNATKTLVGRLVPLSRAILFKGDGMVMGQALEYPNFNSTENHFPEELTATVRDKVIKKGKKEEHTLELLRFNPDRACWREIPAFLVRYTTEDSGRGPLTLGALFDNDLLEQGLDVIVVGISRDKASVKESSELSYPIRPKLLTDIGRRDYEAGLLCAEQWAERLGRAMEAFRSAFDSQWDPTVEKAGGDRLALLQKLKRNVYLNYWTAAEQNVRILFAAANADTDEEAQLKLAEWDSVLRREAVSAYETIGAQLSGRHERAYVLGRQKLFNRKGGNNEQTKHQ